MSEPTKTQRIKALKASIAHWERMRDDRECGEAPDSNDCPMCQLMARLDGTTDCFSCLLLPLCDSGIYSSASNSFDQNLPDWPKRAIAVINHIKRVLAATQAKKAKKGTVR